jgi:hypothetical protein
VLQKMQNWVSFFCPLWCSSGEWKRGDENWFQILICSKKEFKISFWIISQKLEALFKKTLNIYVLNYVWMWNLRCIKFIKEHCEPLKETFRLFSTYHIRAIESVGQCIFLNFDFHKFLQINARHIS